MANRIKPKEQSRGPGAVPVSLNLQKAIVLLLVGTTIIGAVSLLITYGFYADGFSISYMFQVIGFQIVPILAFVIAYLTSPRYPSMINRLFIAILKALVVMLVISLLQTAKNSIGIMYVRQDGVGLPPSWVTSPIGDYIIMAFGLAIFVFVALRRKINT